MKPFQKQNHSTKNTTSLCYRLPQNPSHSRPLVDFPIPQPISVHLPTSCSDPKLRSKLAQDYWQTIGLCRRSVPDRKLPFVREEKPRCLALATIRRETRPLAFSRIAREMDSYDPDASEEMNLFEMLRPAVDIISRFSCVP